MKILITGTAGFIGFHLVEKLAKQDDIEIVGIDNINDYYDVNLKYARLKTSGIDKEKIACGSLVESSIHNNYSFLKLDLADYQSLQDLFKTQKFDIVINLAAQAGVRYSIENPHSYVQSNIVGFTNILECCRYNNIKHLIYASSSSVYGMNNDVPFSENDNVDYPVSFYAATKKSNELMAHTYSHIFHLPTTGLRFFTVYGPWGRPDMAPMLFAKAISEGKAIKVFNHGDMQRDFTFIDDIIAGVAGLIDKLPDEKSEHPFYQIFNIGNSSPVKLMDFISTLENAIGEKAILDMQPIPPGDVTITYADTTKLEKCINYKPNTTIEEGVSSFIEWYNSFY
ncbi:NAD-dependent epimerase [Dysgonomonas sp. 520]|uniref:NAD-dependent epimerase n=1 Tax=Dysgonomonas sp. 520 TaxID=2302931 RepID=UPI0013D6596B|nr:NAD-dependent epimerase [Dysgonomonas sp. 520]NDW08340.1 NAD-dependent epimerase [Dysgonomonas sp. 520]